MMKRLASLVLLAAGLSAGVGCRTKDCADGTIFVEITRTGQGAGDLYVDVSVTIGSDTRHSQSPVHLPMGGSSSFVVTFPNGYPAGKTAVVTLTGHADTADGMIVSGATASPTLGNSCERLELTLKDGVTTDDMGTGDGPAPPDFAGCVPTVTSCPATQTCGRVDDGCGGFVDCAKPCQATGVTPRLANTGDTISFEGTFFTGATVDFPGAPGVALTLAGEHRATATVPAAATAGPIVVHSGSQDLAVGNFRRASYALNLLGFNITQPQTNGAQGPVFLTTPRKFEALVESNGWIYALGGSTNSSGSGSPTASVERVRVNADGSLGYAEDLAGSHLSIARYGHAALVIGDRIYVFGGTDGASALKSYEWATINADGTLSTFTFVDNALTDGRSFPTAHVIGGDVYLFAGRNDTLDLATVEHAPIAADHSLGAFVALPAANNLTQARRAHASFVTSSQVVIVGGTVGGTDLDKIESAPIMGDGTLGAFTNGSVLPSPASNFTGVQWGKTLYAQPYVATVAADGSVGAFTDTSIGIVGSNHSGETRVIVVRDTLYALTGTSTDQTTYDLFARGNLSGGAQLDTFSISGTAAIPNGRRLAGSAVIGDGIYLFGGNIKVGASGTTSPTIYRAPVHADDSIDSFADTGGQIDVARSDFATAVARNHVYVLGGLDMNSMPVKSTASAPIMADGSIGAFTAGPNLTAARYGLRAFVVANVLCVAGGYGGGAYSPVVECTSIGADGTLSGFAVPTEVYGAGTVQLATARAWFTIAVTGDKVLAIAGGNANTTTEFTHTYNVGSTLFEKFASLSGVTLPSSRSNHSSLLVGYWLYTLGGFGTNASLREDTRTLNTPFGTDANANLMESLNDATAALIGNRAYVLGGTNTDISSAIEISTLK